jgi:MinD-like ATPase involved in chromosome partitioning or flagellar assembly
VSEPALALAFTPDPWVEELHRHLTDHGGARVRCLVVEPRATLEEHYDVLVAGHRWPALTRALVADVHGRGRAVLGVFDRHEPASRAHLLDLGVDAVVESDTGPDGIVRSVAAIVATAAPGGAPMPRAGTAPVAAGTRRGRLIVVGGPPGVGRTEIAVHLAAAAARTASAVLADADDVAPALAPRLGLPIEPNLRTAIDAVEHGRGVLAECILTEPRSGLAALVGVAAPRAWSQMRPGEVVRVIDALRQLHAVVVADGAGALDDVDGERGRGRNATARALVAEADAIVAACDASPHGVLRFLAWTAEARLLAPATPLFVVVNRAPESRFRRGELYDEIRHTVGVADVVFVPHDRRVADAAWGGAVVGRSAFARALERIVPAVAGCGGAAGGAQPEPVAR